jgi:alkanesulfonate monooxygenase SsuD/methylene tetrahydromethanopterin reductase-like flavin-dependent oxidoreductase (luciferase family)
MFAARHAEVVFVGGSNFSQVCAHIQDVRTKATLHGRSPDDIKFLVGVAVVVGKTREQAEAKYAEFRRLRSIDGHLAFDNAAVDWTRYAPDARVGDVLDREDPVHRLVARRYPPERTVGEILRRVGGYWRSPLFLVGTPKEVADALEKLVDDSRADGVNLRQFLTPGTAQDFIDLVVPELRRRGRYRESYTEGETFRERLYGPGNSRLLDTHPGACYRTPPRS